jgi:hypothetical protein
MFVKGTVSRDVLPQVFFHESSSPKPLKITLGSVSIFLKIRGDIRKSGCIAGINDTGGKFGTGVNDVGSLLQGGPPCRQPTPRMSSWWQVSRLHHLSYGHSHHGGVLF